MNKQEAVNKLIHAVYTSNSMLVLTESKIEEINAHFKRYDRQGKTFDDYLEDCGDLKSDISKLKSGKYEMEKQYNRGKALQPGILSECNYVETLARIFGLNKCLDCNNTYLNRVPRECIKYLRAGAAGEELSAARYLYYNPRGKDVYLYQYGNPVDGDAEIVFGEIVIKLEFKERNAKAGEYDITGLYDEDGKLSISDDFKQNTPEYIPFIDKFNRETNVIEQIGHNYNSFDEGTKVLSVLEYFSRHNIDAIVSSSSTNELIVLTPDCVKAVLPDGKKIISTDNSEIRTAGRNNRKVFTMGFFMNTLNKMGAVNTAEDMYEVTLNNSMVEIVNGRGTSIPSRVKFNKVFYVDIRNAELNDESVRFHIADVKQLKPSISMHIKINATKEELKEHFKIREF